MPGDGIGREVMPEGLRVLEAAARRFDIELRITPIAWASCDWYARHGSMLPADWKQQLAGVDAIYFGAVGWPSAVPDRISFGETLLTFRRELDHYVKLRPVRVFDGVACPLAGRKAGDIDFLVLRENTEAAPPASERGRRTSDRALQFAFELALSRDRHHLTVATKCEPATPMPPNWDERADAMAARYPEIVVDKQPIDTLCARFVLQPERFDVVVASNAVGDILSDLGPACTGTFALAPSASLNPERRFPSLFEPMHGSAPDISGRNLANPVAMIWSGALMLDFLGRGQGPCRAAHDAILRAIEAVLVEGPHTPDLGGGASTTDVGRAVAERVLR